MWLPLAHPLLGTWPTTQACALTGNWTGDPLIHKPGLNPLSYTSQGTKTKFLFYYIKYRKLIEDFTVALFIIMKNWKQPKCPLSVYWMSNLRYIVKQWNPTWQWKWTSESPSQSSTWLNLRNTTGSEKKQVVKYIKYGSINLLCRNTSTCGKTLRKSEWQLWKSGF